MSERERERERKIGRERERESESFFLLAEKPCYHKNNMKNWKCFGLQRFSEIFLLQVFLVNFSPI